MICDPFPALPADRTDEVLKAKLTQNMNALVYLTWREEARLASFIVERFKAMPADKDSFCATFLIKDETLSQRCRDIVMVPECAEARGYSMEQKLVKIRSGQGFSYAFTKQEILDHIEDVHAAIKTQDPNYLGLEFKTSDLAQTYFSQTVRHFVAIAPAFQTESMAITAVGWDPTYFKYVAAPTLKVLKVLFDTWGPGSGKTFEDALQWVPKETCLDSMDPNDPLVQQIRAAWAPPAPVFKRGELDAFDLRNEIERLEREINEKQARVLSIQGTLHKMFQDNDPDWREYRRLKAAGTFSDGEWVLIVDGQLRGKNMDKRVLLEQIDQDCLLVQAAEEEMEEAEM